MPPDPRRFAQRDDNYSVFQLKLMTTSEFCLTSDARTPISPPSALLNVMINYSVLFELMGTRCLWMTLL